MLILFLPMVTLNGIGKVNRNHGKSVRPRRGLHSPFMMRDEWLLKVNKLNFVLMLWVT